MNSCAFFTIRKFTFCSPWDASLVFSRALVQICINQIHINCDLNRVEGRTLWWMFLERLPLRSLWQLEASPGRLLLYQGQQVLWAPQRLPSALPSLCPQLAPRGSPPGPQGPSDGSGKRRLKKGMLSYMSPGQTAL